MPTDRADIPKHIHAFPQPPTICLVSWDQDGQEAQGVDYGRLTAVLIEATKEQQALIHEQQAQIARLAQEIENIRASIGERRPCGIGDQALSCWLPALRNLQCACNPITDRAASVRSPPRRSLTNPL